VLHSIHKKKRTFWVILFSKMSRNRNRNWCFTINNYSLNDIDLMEGCGEFATYLFQEEKGENGTPHLQGYIEFKDAKTLSSLKKIHPTAHWEKRLGSRKQAIAYCCKKDSRNGEIYTNKESWKLENIEINIEDLIDEERKKHTGFSMYEAAEAGRLEWESHPMNNVPLYQDINIRNSNFAYARLETVRSGSPAPGDGGAPPDSRSPSGRPADV